MRPTIDEQLAGVTRLLDLVAAGDGLPAGSAELLGNAQRLLRKVASSWSTTLPFLLDDNARLAALLGSEPPAATTDVAAAAATNDELRGDLAGLVRELPATDPRRAEIGRYLVRRVAADPT